MRRSKKPVDTVKKRRWQDEQEADDGVLSEEFSKLREEIEERDNIKKANLNRAEGPATVSDAPSEVPSIPPPTPRKAHGRMFLELEVAEPAAPGMAASSAQRKPFGRLEIETFDDLVPRTAANFRALCGAGHDPNNPSGLSYRGNVFHRIVNGFMAQGGDITHEDGTGGESIYGPTFEDESLTGTHDSAGVVAMANSGRNTNNSQFYVTLGACKWLDGKHVVFGKVVSGMSTVQALGRLGSKSGEPSARVVIVSCGEVTGSRSR